MNVIHFISIKILNILLFFFCRYDTLSLHFRQSPMVRRWFCENALLSVPGRLAEYVLVAPTPELRNMFVKLIVLLCHFAMSDEPLQNIQPSADSLCEQILMHVLYLLKTDVPDNGKHLTQYFNMYSMYAGMNTQQRLQLLKVCRSIYIEKSKTKSKKNEKNQTKISKKSILSISVECSGNIHASCIRRRTWSTNKTSVSGIM